MKTMLSNFVYIFRSFRFVSVLNVIGLAVAFATVIVILMQVSFERNFDRCHPTSERVFRVDLVGVGRFSVILPRGFVEYVAHSSPHIKAGTIINPYVGEIYFTVDNRGQEYGYRESVAICDPEIVQIFDFPIIEGDRECLNDPEKIVIPKSMAQKFFKGESAIGKQVNSKDAIWDKDAKTFTVGAVYQDFPQNTQLRNVIYMAITPSVDISNFGSSNYVGYLLLDNAASAKIVEDNCNANFDFTKVSTTAKKMELVPLTDIYYKNESQDGTVFRSGDSDITNLTLFIALLIIIIAAINFANFNASLAPMWIKSINTQKILGASVVKLRFMLFCETVAMCLLSWIVGLFIVYLIYRSNVLPFLEADLDFTNSMPIILIIGALAVLVGIFSGFYPVRFVTSFPPALVLRGSFGLSESGRKLRTILIGFQFVISILFIIWAGFAKLQSSFIRNFSLGFDKDQIVIVDIGESMYNKHHNVYVDKLKEFSGIEEVGFTIQKLGAHDAYTTNSMKIDDQIVQYFMLFVSPEFLKTMGIDVVEGRDFTDAAVVSDTLNNHFILNKNMREQLSAEVGDKLNSESSPIIGFIDNVKLTSLRSGENNLAFVASDYNMRFSYIRLKSGTNPFEAVKHIKSVIAEIDPTYPFEVEFYDTIYNNLYKKENNLRSTITLAGLLAIIISLVGVFSLVAFETQYRRKEIGLRKIHGATVRQILVMFNKTYAILVIICFVVAVPLAYFGVTIWLEGFAQRTPIYWWMFVLALLIVSAITIATVTIQNWKTATMNPVKSIVNN